MRHQIGYIALSLLAAALAGCSSADTGSNSPSGQEPLTGSLAKYQSKITTLTNSPSFTGTALTVQLAASELAVLSIRAVDKAMLVNGATVDNAGSTLLSASVKSVTIEPAVAAALNATSETVLIDIRNGVFAQKGAANTGISIDLGTGAGTDEIAILDATTAGKLGCVNDATDGDLIGLKTATSKDITMVNAVAKLTVDLNSGDDSWNQADCTIPVAVYGGAGKDTIIAGSVDTADDTYSGGAGLDTLSYANRTAAVAVNLSAGAITVPFVMAAGEAGQTGEADSITDDIETITGSAYNDAILSGALTTVYTLNGGAGNDTFITALNAPAIINGGAGTDTVDYSARLAAITATMGNSAADDGETAAAGKDNIKNDVENYIASAIGDTVTGNALNNSFTSGDGDDTFSGGEGDDTFVAADADGDDIFNGGNGIDTADYSGRAAAVCISLSGVLTASVWSGNTSGLCANISAVDLTDSATYLIDADAEEDHMASDVDNAKGTAGADLIVGNALSNTLYGLGGDDRLVGLAGNDQLDEDGIDCTSDDVQVLCGSDPLDIFTCEGATGSGLTQNYGFGTDTCWKIQ